MFWIRLLRTAVLAAAARAVCLWQDSNPLNDKANQECQSNNSAVGWQGPESCSGKWCLYWNPQYNNGQGLALITTAEHAKEAATYTETEAPPPTAPETTAPFRVAEIPGKGRGLVATRPISKGEVVMAARPVLVVEVDAYHELPDAEARHLYTQALDKLSQTARERFMNQAGDDVRVKLGRNTFTVWIGPSGRHMGAYPQASLINHDCRPSTTYRLSNLTHTTRAVRDIQQGEEISISYIDVLQPRDKRQARLREWGFDCRCRQCSLPAAAAAASDANVARIRDLAGILDSVDGAAEPVTADMGRELVEMHARERLDLYLGPACTRAALNYGTFGMRDEAVEYGRRAIEALTNQVGSDAPDLPSLRALVEDPTTHWTWGLRKRTAEPEKNATGQGRRAAADKAVKDEL